MKPQCFSLLVVLSCFAASTHAGSEELPRFGKLPDPGRKWSVRESGTNGTSSHGWSWVVFTNSHNGDLLSIGAQKLGDGLFPRVNRITWSDTAGEIFPAGYPAWTGERPRVRVNWLRNDVVKLTGRDHALKKNIVEEALQYSIVFEDDTKPGTNRLAHGYALAVGGVSVFVQHTSAKPITPDDAEMFATALISTGTSNSR